MAGLRTKRHYGDGSYWYDKKTGRHVWRYQGHTVADRDEARAKAKLDDLKVRLGAGVGIRDARQTLREYMTRYVEGLDVKATTAHDYGKRADYYILPTLGDQSLSALDNNRALIKSWLAAMVAHVDPRSGKPWALSSIKQALSLLERCLNEAESDKLIRVNPAAGLRAPTRRRGDETKIDDAPQANKALTPELLATLLEEVKRTDREYTTSSAARSYGMYLLYQLACQLGLRRGELCGLRWKDIDLDTATIHVRQQVVRMDTDTAVTTPKTESGKRAVPADDLMMLLRRHKLRSGGTDDGYVFVGEDGAHLKPNSVTQHFRRAAKRIGLVGYTLHDLRGTWVTNMRRSGVDLEVIAALAGHKTVKVTAETYSDAQMDRKRAAMKKASGG